MGYQITFVPTEEKMKEFKPWNDDTVKSTNNSIKTIKREIISMCLKGNQENTSIYQLEKDLSFKLEYLKRCVRDQEKYDAYLRWKEDDEHELWYCGWEFSHESNIDEEDYTDNVLDKLIILADVVKTENYFENSERFYDKWNEIKEELDGFVEIIQDIAIHEIIEKLDDFKKKYDDENEEIYTKTGVCALGISRENITETKQDND